MAVLREKDLHKPTLRVIKRLQDGAIKTQVSALAARLVAKGTYVYADGGPDESKHLPLRKKISTAEKTPSEVLHLAKVPEIIPTGDGEQFSRSTKTLRTDDIMETGSSPDFEPRADRKIRKKVDIPKEKMDYILKSNIANPISVQPSRDTGSLKEIMEKARSKRK
jgi:hypothetical protein